MTKHYKAIFFLITIIINISLGNASWAEARGNAKIEDKCIVQRAIFELGSGVTTIALAKIDTLPIMDVNNTLGALVSPKYW